MTFEQWRRHVLDNENLFEWKVVQSAEAYCWYDTKTITFPINRQSYSLFLHEVAHALYQEPEGPMKNHYHGGQWAFEYGRLVDKYLSRAIPVADAACELIEKVGTVLRPNVSYVDFNAAMFNRLANAVIEYAE